MTRISLRVSLALVDAAGLSCASLRSEARAAEPAVAGSEITVKGDYITLGDLFDTSALADQPDAAALAIAASPAPGGRVVIDLSRARAIAQAHGITLPLSRAVDSVIVTRASRVVGAEAIEQALLDAIAARGMPGHFRIRFSGPEPVLYVPSDAETSVAVDSLDLEPATGQFRAKLRAPAGDTRSAPLTLVGRAYVVAQVPIPARAISAGEVISERDLTWTEIPTERLAQNVITQAEDLVGFAPRRDLRAGAPILSGDVKKPIVVAKNTIVSMIVRTPGMTLTAQGRALEEGAKGESIRVLNTQTKRTIQATVVSPGEVLVQTAATHLAALP
jgi:flagella basal body P-ring formation protein FlgA